MSERSTDTDCLVLQCRYFRLSRALSLADIGGAVTAVGVDVSCEMYASLSKSSCSNRDVVVEHYYRLTRPFKVGLL